MRQFFRWYAIPLTGTLTNVGDIIKYHFTVSSNCKRLLGAFIYSNTLANSVSTNFNLHFSLSINNREKNLLSKAFTMGRNDNDDMQSRIVQFDEKMEPGQEISGYVENLVLVAGGYDVKVYLRFASEEKLTEKIINEALRQEQILKDNIKSSEENQKINTDEDNEITYSKVKKENHQLI